MKQKGEESFRTEVKKKIDFPPSALSPHQIDTQFTSIFTTAPLEWQMMSLGL
jgi:hypothetical protein